MARRQQTRGKCVYCGREMTRGGLARHLSTCAGRQAAVEAADQKPGKEQTMYHLQVQDAWGGTYWLHLEMQGTATLEELDHYLRAIWLECCGHLSSFSIGPYRYTQLFDDGLGMDDDRAMNVQVRRLFRPGMAIPYEYDFGTTSELMIQVVDKREGRPTTPHPIALMARNDPPEIVCMECGQPAAYLCVECMYETDESGALCETHAGEHPHDNYGEPMPVVNSPRIGMCGYEGPAEPPY
ncbi:MAG: plasmid pRiA4b ORF-3 family protein [Chloroflexi bacterium]|nr:plasmid pRiA4b ORF-3 family protein [Chloroflexota bacterium]MCI0647895.1 plasmid pRiA4b ORF-3 family protein [Chloroflexota bacterium]MCI0727146.1 plasmid pRiA4b ORF-3 family protein [Chloroflexota bacterium]